MIAHLNRYRTFNTKPIDIWTQFKFIKWKWPGWNKWKLEQMKVFTENLFKQFMDKFIFC